MSHDNIELSLCLFDLDSEFSLKEFFISAMNPVSPCLTGPWDDSLSGSPPLLDLTAAGDDNIDPQPDQCTGSDHDTSSLRFDVSPDVTSSSPALNMSSACPEARLEMVCLSPALSPVSACSHNTSSSFATLENLKDCVSSQTSLAFKAANEHFALQKSGACKPSSTHSTEADWISLMTLPDEN